MKTRLVTDPVVECLLIGVLLSLAFWPLTAVSQVPEGWQPVRFEGETSYRLEDGCWKARAMGTASGLARESEVDLTRTPYLHWAWQADAMPDWPDVDEQTQEGDDFLARVYVIRKGFLPWQTQAINYVWSRQYPAGAHWPNPFARQAHMVVVQGADSAEGWQVFSRNVREDFRRYHGVDLDTIDAVAIMSDGDNTQTRLTACYRLPTFEARP